MDGNSTDDGWETDDVMGEEDINTHMSSEQGMSPPFSVKKPHAGGKMKTLIDKAMEATASKNNTNSFLNPKSNKKHAKKEEEEEFSSDNDSDYKQPSNAEDDDESDSEVNTPEPDDMLNRSQSDANAIKNIWPADNEKLKLILHNNKNANVEGSVLLRGKIFIPDIVESETAVMNTIQKRDVVLADTCVIRIDSNNSVARALAIEKNNCIQFYVLTLFMEIQLVVLKCDDIDKKPQWTVWKEKASKFNNDVSAHGSNVEKLIFGDTKGCIYMSTKLYERKRMPKNSLNRTPTKDSTDKRKRKRTIEPTPTQSDNITLPLAPVLEKRKRTQTESVAKKASSVVSTASSSVTTPSLSEDKTIDDSIKSTPKSIKVTNKQNTATNNKEQSKPSTKEVVHPVSDLSCNNNTRCNPTNNPICEVKFTFCSMQDVHDFFKRNNLN